MFRFLAFLDFGLLKILLSSKRILGIPAISRPFWPQPYGTRPNGGYFACGP